MAPEFSMESHLSSITHVIQLSVAPVFLLTAIGALINALNIRLNRIIDRRRAILDRLYAPGSKETAIVALTEDLERLAQRGGLIYLAIFFAVLSALLVCVLVTAAFCGALLSVELAEIVAGLFVLAMAALIIAWWAFLHEIYLAVRAGVRNSR